MKETVMPGPCVICGLSNYPLSAGGPTICPSCDCGDFGPTKIERQRKEIERLQSLADDMGQTNIMNQIKIERLKADTARDDEQMVRDSREIERLQIEVNLLTISRREIMEIDEERVAEIAKLRDQVAGLSLRATADEVAWLQQQEAQGRELAQKRLAEIEQFKAVTAHAAGFLDGMADRIERWVLWDSGEGDVESFAKAAADCRAIAASLQRLLEP